MKYEKIEENHSEGSTTTRYRQTGPAKLPLFLPSLKTPTNGKDDVVATARRVTKRYRALVTKVRVPCKDTEAINIAQTRRDLASFRAGMLHCRNPLPQHTDWTVWLHGNTVVKPCGVLRVFNRDAQPVATPGAFHAEVRRGVGGTASVVVHVRFRHLRGLCTAGAFAPSLLLERG